MTWPRPLIPTLMFLALAACSSDGGSETEVSLLDGTAVSVEAPSTGSGAVDGTTGGSATSTPDDAATTTVAGTAAGGSSVTTTPQSAPPSTAAGGSVAPPTIAGGGPPTTIAADAGTTTTITVVGGPAELAYCTALITYKDTEELVDDAFADELTEPATLAPLLTDLDTKMAGVEAVAPPVIDADIDTLAAPRRQLIQLIVANGYDLAAVEEDPAAEAVLEALSTDEGVDAEVRVRTFNDDVCGLDTDF
jgi:hypothetical protein